MDKQLRVELRKLLTGRTIRNEDGWLIAVPEGNYLVYHGIVDRTGHRKPVVREERVQAADDNEQAFHVVMKSLRDVGILVHMETKPDALCALCRLFLTKSVILTVLPEGEDGHVLIQAYTGRSILAHLCCRMAITNLTKKMNLNQEN